MFFQTGICSVKEVITLNEPISHALRVYVHDRDSHTDTHINTHTQRKKEYQGVLLHRADK